MEVIYLEDKPDVAATGVKMLFVTGYRPRHFACAQELFEHVMSGVVPGSRYFLDHENYTPTNVSGISGGQIGLEVLARDPQARVVIGTGRDLTDLPEDVQAAVAQGTMKYLPKPYRLRDLREMYN